MNGYTRITVSLVVGEDELDNAAQDINNYLDGLDSRFTVYDSSLETAPADEPVNAAEIAAK